MINFLKKILQINNPPIKSKAMPLDLAKVYLLDVRNPDELERGSIKGAFNIPLNQLEQSLNNIPNNKKIIVFCRSGNRAERAVAILKSHGITASNGGSWKDVSLLI